MFIDMANCVCIYVQGRPVEIHARTHRNLIGRSMTAPAACVIAQQYSFATFVSLRFHSSHYHKEKFGASFKNAATSVFLLVLKLRV